MNIVSHFAFDAVASTAGYAHGQCCVDEEFDLDRVVWDPEYRREVIDLLAEREPVSGDAESPG